MFVSSAMRGAGLPPSSNQEASKFLKLGGFLIGRGRQPRSPHRRRHKHNSP